MKILLVVDGSSYSDAATQMVEALRLPSKTEVTVLTVVPEHTFLGGITLDVIRGTTRAREKAQEEQQQKALELLQGTTQPFSKSELKVKTMVRWGNPVEEILKVSAENGTSLVVMGSKGLTDSLAFRLGNVALAVMKHAKTSVLLVRPKSASVSKAIRAGGKRAVINRVLLATDGSKYSDRATQVLLDLPLPHQSELIAVTALQSHLAAWVKTPTLDFQTNREILVKLQTAEESEARKITATSEKQFQAKGYKTASVVLRGGAAESILTAAKEHNIDIIAVGSKGLTGIESLFLGSVAERVARHANCSVLIGR